MNIEKKSTNLKVVWCGYRSWSMKMLELTRGVEIIASFSDPDEFSNFMKKDNGIEVIVVAGWSWKISEHIIDKYICIGLHPSDLPSYRGGSPLQHQIMAGLENTQLSLFKLTKNFDDGPVLAKSPMSLLGNMDEIFEELVIVGSNLLNTTFAKWPNWKFEKQNQLSEKQYKRRKPEQSRINIKEIQTMTLKDLYNFIRALGDPYPNAFIEDEKGNRLLFKEVEYKQSESN